jgi:hypothetical protein
LISFLTTFFFSGGDGKETKKQAWSSTEPEAKHFKSWPNLMYALIQGFRMYNANMFGLNMIKGFVGMSLVMKLVHSGSKIFRLWMGVR